MGNCYSQIDSIFHVSLLKPFHTGGDGYLHPTAVNIKDEQEWEVSGILKHKQLGEKRNYPIVYAGYDEYEAYWLPESKFINVGVIFSDYKVSHGLN